MLKFNLNPQLGCESSEFRDLSPPLYILYISSEFRDLPNAPYLCPLQETTITESRRPLVAATMTDERSQRGNFLTKDTSTGNDAITTTIPTRRKCKLFMRYSMSVVHTSQYCYRVALVRHKKNACFLAVYTNRA